jgi:hypothetical protein
MKTILTIILTLLAAYFLVSNVPYIRAKIFPAAVDRSIQQDSLSKEIVYRDSIIANLKRKDLKDAENIAFIGRRILNLERKIESLAAPKKVDYSQYTIDSFFVSIFRQDSIDINNFPVVKDSTVEFLGFQAVHLKHLIQDKINFKLELDFYKERDTLKTELVENLKLKVVSQQEKIENKDKIIATEREKYNLLNDKYKLMTDSEIELRNKVTGLEKKNEVLKKITYISVPLAALLTTVIAIAL